MPSGSVPWKVSRLDAHHPDDVLEVPAGGLTFGRSSDNDVVLSGQSFPGVSSRHARIQPEGPGLVIEDLGSRNGTFVDGRRVERVALQHGRTVQLGSGGPRFVILATERLEETVAIPPPVIPDGEADGAGERHSVGAETMFSLRSQLGIPEGTRVEEMVSHGARRSRGFALAMVGVLALAVGIGGWIWFRSGNEAFASLEERLDEQRRDAEGQRKAWQEYERRLEEAREAWENQRVQLVRDRDALAASLRRLEQDESVDDDERARLRDELREAQDRLERYDPVNLEHEKLERIARCEESVVLIETTMRMREEESGDLLHVYTDAALGAVLNLEGVGRPSTRSCSGSGFCVDEEGWIVTNAHVVLKEAGVSERHPFEGKTLVEDLELWVTFSGESERHAAELVDWRRGQREDLALLKIEPFEGMPHLPGFDLRRGSPPYGTDVYLIGFPLGKEILQEGQRVLASTFRGILSRTVDYYLQVDAAVHPGVSGGPVYDGKGELIGVVVGMDAETGRSGSSAIGYVIPIEEVSSIWPPRKRP